VGVLGYRFSHFSASQSTVAINHAPTSPAADLPELRQIAPLAPPDDVPVLVTRGATTTHGPSVDDLMPAFRAYNRNDFAQAAAAFAPLVPRFPQSDIPPLYLGVSQLQLGQNADAQRSLAQAYSLTGSAHHDAAAWYLAMADLRLHQSAAAIPLLRDLCVQQRNPYAARACTLAQQIGPS
jgi:TolA-binding protein